MNIVEIFPNFHKIHINKDPGQIPIWLKKYGHNVTLVTNKTHHNIYLKEFHGVKVINLQRIEIFSISFSLLYYLLRNTKQINCLLLYHLTVNSAIFSLIYLIFARRGVVILKLDTDGRVWECSVPFFFKIYRYFLGETKIVPYIISKTADLLIIESPDARKRILKKYPFFEKKIIVLPNGINKEILTEYKKEIPEISKSKIILFVGQIIYRKGVDILIRAFSQLKDLYPEWRLEFVGRFVELKYKKELDDLVVSLNLQNRVIFSGHLEGQDLIKKYLESEIFCFPSRHESFGLVLLEAMYLGLPIISSNTGCAEYLLDYGKCGLIFEIENIDKLKLRLKDLIENDAFRKELGNRTKTRCLTMFTWNNIVYELNKVITDILEKKVNITS